jgi:hypothetical protein
MIVINFSSATLQALEGRMTIESLWLYPPLAIARLGGSSIPLEAFSWGEDQNTPHGTGKTTISPALTFRVADDGSLASYLPEAIQFKDNEGFRPVCPFFELHARCVDSDGNITELPVTAKLLDDYGISSDKLVWSIQVANLKPYNMSHDPDTRIEARIDFTGDDHQIHDLEGKSPHGAASPLVPADKFIPLGKVQVIRPTADYPELRLRFTPAKGIFYGPTDLLQRWKNVTLDARTLFLNKDSTWCSWKPNDDDPRGTPGGQYAQDDDGVSYGMVDDVCDGIISCSIAAGPWTANNGSLVAQARIAVGPPDYAPDRRHLVSLADGLKDRVDRADVYDDKYYSDDELCDLEITELMRRIYETASLNNVDVFNNRVNIQENPQTALQLGIPFQPMEFFAFPYRDPLDQRPLPLSDAARENHRRFSVIAAFLDFIRRQPGMLAQYVREPLDREPFFDHRMPAVMRGPSGAPLSLTRRQYEYLMQWVSRRSQSSDGDTKP